MGEQPLTGGNTGPESVPGSAVPGNAVPQSARPGNIAPHDAAPDTTGGAAGDFGAPAAIGGYRLQGLLGFGAVGPVHLAVALEGPTGALSTVALTAVRPELSADEGFRERLRIDLEAARRVQGPRAVPVVGADPDGEPPWFASEYISGPSLGQALAQHGPMPPEGVRTLLEGIAQGLEAVHATGLPHLALDPTSVLLSPSGPRVTGFGVVRALEAAALSRRGVIARSPLFMAPEQITDREASTPADIFALGHLAAFALLGRSPFGAGDPIALAHRIVHESPDLGALPPILRPVIERCLARDPEQRPTLARVIHFCRIAPSTPAVALTPTPTPTAPSAPASPAVPERIQPLPALTYAPPPPPPPGPHPASSPRTARAPRWPLGTLGTALLSAGAVVALVVGVVLAGRSPAATGPGLHPVAQPSIQHSATPKPSGRPTASPSPTPAIDPCLIGSWTGVSDDLVNHIDGNPVTFVSKGPNTTFQADGTSTVDYGSGTTYAATYQGHAWKTVFKGSATMHTMTRGGTLYTSNVSANGSWVLSEDGSTNNSGQLSINQTPGPYSCSATTLVEYTPDGTDTETFSRNR